jgi:predicted ArsR family transcriptional regulator
MALLRLLAAEPLTITGVGRQLGVHPANLTHHFRRLRAVGLIRLVSTRDTGRNLEKYYAASAKQFTVRPATRKKASRQSLALSILRDNLAAAAEDDGPDEAIALLATARVRPADWKRFAARLQALLASFRKADADGGQLCTLNASLYTEHALRLPAPAIRVAIR